MIPLDLPIDVGGEEARRRATEELAKGKYHPVPGFVEDAINWLRDLLQRLLEMLLGGPSGTGGPTLVVALIVGLLLIGVIIIAIRVGLPAARARRSGALVDADPTRSPEDYRAEADQAADRGDFSTAVIARFRAIVRDLEVHTIIRARASRTAIEAATLAGNAFPAIAADLGGCAQLFNDVAYGHRAATADEWALLHRTDAAVVEGLRRGVDALEAQA